MPELSIIVPVYKVEKYLPKCIDSILAQTFTDFELILIDDGSPDRCGQICDEYAAKDPRIRVIHQENQGVSAARNAGLDVATGTYIGFVDSDDWIEPEMYEKMVHLAQENCVDIVICGLSDYSENGLFIRNILSCSGIYSKDNLLKSIFNTPNELGGGCVNKIFKHLKIVGVRFQEGIRIAEDWLFLFECYKRCDNALKHTDCLYNITERQNSVTRENEIAALSDILLGGKASVLLLQSARRYSHELECIAINKYFDDCIRFARIIRKNAKKSKQPYRLIIHRIKFQMIKRLPRVMIKRLLTREQMHRYLFEMLKI